MKRTIKILCILSITFISTQLSAQSLIFNNGSHLVNGTDVYWVFDNGNFNLSSSSTTEPLVFENIKISDDAVLNIGSQTNVTVNDSLIKGLGLSRMTLKSDPAGSASLITLGSIKGRATAEKFLPASYASGSTVASPVRHTLPNIFTGSIGAYYYNAVTLNWSSITSPELEVMRGYWTKYAADHTLLFNDTLNTGEIKYTEFYRIAPYGYGNMGWNFLGNPYPSAIDWDLVVALNGGVSGFVTSTKLNNAVYVSNNNGAYNSFVTGVGTNGFNGIVPAYTAFWTQVNSNFHDPLNPLLPIAGAQLIFNNTVRVHQNLTTGNKTSNNNGIIRLFAKKAQMQDEIILRLMTDATMSFDPSFDALKMMSEENIAPQFFMLPDNATRMSINSLPTNLTLPYSIPLGVKSVANETHQINVDLYEFENDQISVHLEDKVKNTLTDVRQQPSYNYLSLVDEDSQRFILHLGLTTAGMNDFASSEAQIYSYDNCVFISNLHEQTTFTLYNMLGQEIHSQILTEQTSKIDFYLPKAYYLVRLTGNNTSLTKKVFINSKI
ncbi:MAG: T9SS type A sorting domain-containing protein [Bacteroidales bacterium]|nr:T9SS type A sorting domain-containing protein [Bacteroidales bacterium]